MFLSMIRRFTDCLDSHHHSWQLFHRYYCACRVRVVELAPYNSYLENIANVAVVLNVFSNPHCG